MWPRHVRPVFLSKDWSGRSVALARGAFRLVHSTFPGFAHPKGVSSAETVHGDVRTFSGVAENRDNGPRRTQLPNTARVVVIGGGVIGSSIAYHLGKLGWGSDTVLVERDRLTSGTTWHAAGLMVTMGSLSETSTEMRKYTKQLYSALEAETGQSTGFKPCGFIELASDHDHLEEFRRVAVFNRRCGVDVQEISPAQVKELFPLCDVSDILAGFYVKDDGRVNPVDATAALAKGARQSGCTIAENTTVEEVLTKNGRVSGVRLSDNHIIQCEYVVNATGMWARQFAEQAGISIPNQAAEHYYIVTDRMEEVNPDWPVIEDPARHAYIRPEAGGLMVGLFEPDAAAWSVDSIPHDFSFGEIEPDYDRVVPFVTTAMSRVPATQDAGIRNFFCGPESFTPDLAPVIGEAAALRNYFVAAGLNSIGILTGGGVGRLVAGWVVNGEPDMDVTAFSPNRFRDYQLAPSYRRDRVEESLGLVYKCHYPYRDTESARGIMRSPIHSQLEDQRACFRDVSGWEGADWFAPQGVEPVVPPLTWARPHWFDYWKAEHVACREAVVLMDMSFMSKFHVEGVDAARILNLLSTANVDPDPIANRDGTGTITYTQWLSPTGKMKADLTVTKLAPEKFMVVSSDNTRGDVLGWMQRHCAESDKVHISDTTGALAQLNIQGPHSRKLLQSVTSADMGDSAFPFRSVQKIDIGYCYVNCARITYLGELGYELYIPSEFAVHVYNVLLEAGQPFGLRLAGLKALSSLRMEKGYRDYGHDMDNTDSILEVGLGFTCDFEKDGGFLGRDAVLAQKSAGPLQKRLLQVLVDDPTPHLYHGEAVLRNNVVVGDIRAASYGHTLGGAVGLAMVEADEPVSAQYIREGEWTVDIGGQQFPARASLRPLYDPGNTRIKC